MCNNTCQVSVWGCYCAQSVPCSHFLADCVQARGAAIRVESLHKLATLKRGLAVLANSRATADAAISRWHKEAARSRSVGVDWQWVLWCIRVEQSAYIHGVACALTGCGGTKDTPRHP